MLRACVLDLKGSWEEHLPLVEFAYNKSYQASIQMAPYEDFYGRPCRSRICWTEVGKSSITGPDLIRDTSDKVGMIRKRLLTTQSRQKSYADVRRRSLEFEAGDHVFFKVMLNRAMIRFGKQGKLSSRYIGRFVVLERVGTVAYRLALPLSLLSIHEEGPVRIMDSQEQVLRDKTVRLVKVLWQHRGVKEATWEREDTVCANSLFLFNREGVLSNH